MSTQDMSPEERARTPLGRSSLRVGIVNEQTGKVTSWHEVSRQDGSGQLTVRDTPLGRLVSFTEARQLQRNGDGTEAWVSNMHLISEGLVKVRTWDTNYYGERINQRTRSAARYLAEAL